MSSQHQLPSKEFNKENIPCRKFTASSRQEREEKKTFYHNKLRTCKSAKTLAGPKICKRLRISYSLTPPATRKKRELDSQLDDISSWLLAAISNLIFPTNFLSGRIGGCECREGNSPIFMFNVIITIKFNIFAWWAMLLSFDRSSPCFMRRSLKIISSHLTPKEFRRCFSRHGFWATDFAFFSPPTPEHIAAEAQKAKANI